MDGRAKQLHNIARGYVHSLGKGDFDAIPYDNDVELRAPFCPGGSSVPLVGRSNLKEVWWAPMPSLVAGTEVIDTYVNENLSAVTVEFLCHIKEPACILRIVDRFKINAEGSITSQENFFDPRDVTHPVMARCLTESRTTAWRRRLPASTRASRPLAAACILAAAALFHVFRGANRLTNR